MKLIVLKIKRSTENKSTLQSTLAHLFKIILAQFFNAN